jgi:hypothetical protein
VPSTFFSIRNERKKGDKKMQQETKTQNDITRALYAEVAHNREVLSRIDENAPFDTPETIAALNTAIHQLKAGTAYKILYNTGTHEKGSFNYLLSQVKNDIFFLRSIADQDTNTMIPEKYKPLLQKIGPQSYLKNIKECTEQIYKILSTQ